MATRLWMFAATLVCGTSMFAACSIGNDDNPVGDDPTGQSVEVQQLSTQMAAVRDYVPLYAVLAHRGSTYWTPEETESAWRWAREMGADYLESDLQCTKDGVILANHDVNLKRTTNIEAMFAEGVPQSRVQFYEGLGFSHADAQEQYEHDAADFQPYYTRSYYYAELLMLDAGAWFNAARPEQARPRFAATRNGSLSDSRIRYSNGQYVSALQDQMAYARGKMLKRGNDGERVLPYAVKSQYQGMTLREIRQATGGDMMDFLEYDFSQAYVVDPQDSGHRPGIYIEFKSPEYNPPHIEQMVYDILDHEGWNIISRPATETAFYRNGKVNAGNTNGKVILQTFSKKSMQNAYAIFKGLVPMCYLLEINHPPLPDDFDYSTPERFAKAIKWAQDNGAHILGPSIAGAPNNYDEINAPWQAALTRRSGMLNHPYSFDTNEQMAKYMGTLADDLATDGCFTNRSDLSLRYLIDNGFRCNANIPHPFHPGQTYDNSQAPATVPDPIQTLQRLGY